MASLQGVLDSLKVQNGALTLRVLNQEPGPAAWHDADVIQIPAGTAVATYDVSWADEMSFEISGLTAETIGVRFSRDGVNFSSIDQIPWDNLTNAAAVSAALGNGDYTIPLNCKKVQFVPSAAVETPTITWSAKSTGRNRMA